MSLPFDLAEATRHLAAKDEKLAALIAETAQFHTEMDAAQSPYEALLESIACQSISGKAAATIFNRPGGPQMNRAEGFWVPHVSGLHVGLFLRTYDQSNRVRALTIVLAPPRGQAISLHKSFMNFGLDL